MVGKCNERQGKMLRQSWLWRMEEQRDQIQKKAIAGRVWKDAD